MQLRASFSNAAFTEAAGDRSSAASTYQPATLSVARLCDDAARDIMYSILVSSTKDSRMHHPTRSTGLALVELIIYTWSITTQTRILECCRAAQATYDLSLDVMQIS